MSRSPWTAVVACAPLLVSVALATTARADAGEDQFLADLYTPGMAYPPLSTARLLQVGHQACVEVGNGADPDTERDNISMRLANEGIISSRAEVGTLVHFALKDLCPQVPNTTGI